MASFLTSWKEIAQYLGKAVRTAQRWELDFGLPVRRPPSPSRQAVLAIPEEIDTWMRCRMKGSGGPAAEQLRQELAALRGEIATLRQRLDSLENRGTGEVS
jgi:hypothetical protein